MTSHYFARGLIPQGLLGRGDLEIYKNFCYDAVNFNFTLTGSAEYRLGCWGEYNPEGNNYYNMARFDNYLILFYFSGTTPKYNVMHNGKFLTSGGQISSWTTRIDHTNSHFNQNREGLICTNANYPTGERPGLLPFNDGSWGSEQAIAFTTTASRYPQEPIISSSFYDNRLVLVSETEIAFSSVTNWRNFSSTTGEGAPFKVIPNFGVGRERIRWVKGAKQACYVGTSSCLARLASPNQAPITLANIIARVLDRNSCAPLQPTLYRNSLLYVDGLRARVMCIYHNEYTDDVFIKALNLGLPLKNVEQPKFQAGDYKECAFFLAQDGTTEEKFLWKITISGETTNGWGFDDVALSKHQSVAGYRDVETTFNTIYYLFNDYQGVVGVEHFIGSPYKPYIYNMYLDLARTQVIEHNGSIVVTLEEATDSLTVSLTIASPQNLVGRQLKIFLELRPAMYVEVINYQGENPTGASVFLVRFIKGGLRESGMGSSAYISFSEMLWCPPEVRDTRTVPVAILDEGKIVNRFVYPDQDGVVVFGRECFEVIVGLEYKGSVVCLPAKAYTPAEELDYHNYITQKIVVLLSKSHVPTLSREILQEVSLADVSIDGTHVYGTSINDEVLETSAREMVVQDKVHDVFSGLRVDSRSPMALNVNGIIEHSDIMNVEV